MPSSHPDRAEVLSYVLEKATTDDLDLLLDAQRKRRALLAEITSAGVVPGVTVTTHGLKPRYLNDLVGTVVRIETIGGKRCATLALDSLSTAQLAIGSRGRHIPEGASDTYELTGIPVVACAPRLDHDHAADGSEHGDA